MTKQVIVVGGGLAGGAAANTALEHGANVLLLDKSAFCGGNSSKATSGINGCPTEAQRNANVKDSHEIFIADSMRGGATNPDLVEVLCNESGEGVEWLINEFQLDLSKVSRLGGHTRPRTHRGNARFPGMTITSTLITMLEDIQKNSDRVKVVTKAKVIELIKDNNNVIGVIYKKGDMEYKEYGQVILATGGYGADFTPDSILLKNCPRVEGLATTNGEHCTGDGIKLGLEVGSAVVDLDQVQVHPTGLVNESDPNNSVKFLAAEALRGVGGLLLDGRGNRFVNELQRRDNVSNTMFDNEAPFFLMLNSKATAEIEWHVKHYIGRNVMKSYSNGKEFCKERNIDYNVFCKTLETYNEIAQKTNEYLKIAEKNISGDTIKLPKGVEEPPYNAYPAPYKTYDPFGKLYFQNTPVSPEDTWSVAIVTPVVHYCMGGLKINQRGECIDNSGQAIMGLYAIGEVAGGVHGTNRLGGSSLVDCLVYGRIAGRNAAKNALGIDYKGAVNKLATLAGPIKETIKQSIEPISTGPKYFTLEEVAKHNTESDCWVAVNGQVLDVTSFLPDHPGGKLAILTFAGRDASEEFNMLHPRDVIEKYTPEAVIGLLGTPPTENSTTNAPVEKSFTKQETKAKSPEVLKRQVLFMLVTIFTLVISSSIVKFLIPKELANENHNFYSSESKNDISQSWLKPSTEISKPTFLERNSSVNDVEVLEADEVSNNIASTNNDNLNQNIVLDVENNSTLDLSSNPFYN